MSVVTRVTPTGTPTPTKPAPMAMTIPKMFSLERAWTTTPWRLPNPKPESLTVPFETPPRLVPPVALAVRVPAASACTCFVKSRM